jgi:hypothetical protein
LRGGADDGRRSERDHWISGRRDGGRVAEARLIALAIVFQAGLNAARRSFGRVVGGA